MFVIVGLNLMTLLHQIHVIHRQDFKHISQTLHLLYLQSNKITSIAPSAFENMRELRTLDLSGNQISTMDGRFLEKTLKLNHLFWSLNPWNCDDVTVCFTTGILERRTGFDGEWLETKILDLVLSIYDQNGHGAHLSDENPKFLEVHNHRYKNGGLRKQIFITYSEWKRNSLNFSSFTLEEFSVVKLQLLAAAHMMQRIPKRTFNDECEVWMQQRLPVFKFSPLPQPTPVSKKCLSF